MALLKQKLGIIGTLIILLTTVTCLRSYDPVGLSKVGAMITSGNGIEEYNDNDKKQVIGKEEEKEDDDDDNLFCAVLNPLSGAYIDLSQLSSTPNKPQDTDRGRGRSGSDKEATKSRWLIRGWNYNTNFTLGICSSPVTSQEEGQLTNYTGGFYKDPINDGRLVSIGNFGTKPLLMGNKKLTLKYENGSMCPNGVDRKSTLLYFVCDKEIATKAQITYIGNLHDCSYFFEVRSIYACPTSNKSKEVNILGIFISILAVFFLVEYGGRRWLYGKMKTHFNSKPLTNFQYSGAAADERTLHPRWEFIEREPRWKAFIKRVGNLFSGLLVRSRTFPRPTMNTTGSIRLNSSHSRSQESFLRDMEQQNNIIDSLEVTTNGSTSTSDSARRLD